MLYQDSRRGIYQNYQDQAKLNRPRSISNNAISYSIQNQQQKYKTDIASNYQTSISEVRQVNQNQRNHSLIQGGENNPKILNQQQPCDYNNFHAIKYTNEILKERLKTATQCRNNHIDQIKEARSQEKQQKIANSSQTRQIKQSDNDLQNLLRLTKTEAVNHNKTDHSKVTSSDIRQRMKNYPQKSSSPSRKTHTRPRSSMEDKSVTIMSFQLKDMKENIQSKDLQKICYDMGYHVVKFDRDYDKINNRLNGQGQLQIRGTSNDSKFQNLQANLNKKGIYLGDQNLNLKDIISNKYLLKKQEHSQVEPNLNQDEKLFNNFLKFQRRQRGQFI
ncbi:unnamed protein product (macronuclear) [Paramecium tetraurelia]|uniref:Uncharacterized protein n=1 Tax=Paramecium tetraurelia TaxID=5888 RepID=A0CXX1_PARTE|nr:uncharacterized protein GSPATT00011270001 [Paramecium tetraurelia]CAK75638.1 unnamed protein product [Paramecium tetraurelia]|eukprot:XP_001443035.1 hypothetical protein (macronuclear) [Paramecium tetraurelia strain d4-2]